MSLIQDIIKISRPFWEITCSERRHVYPIPNPAGYQHSAISDSSPLLGPRSLLCLHFCCCVSVTSIWHLAEEPFLAMEFGLWTYFTSNRNATRTLSIFYFNKNKIKWGENNSSQNLSDKTRNDWLYMNYVIVVACYLYKLFTNVYIRLLRVQAHLTLQLLDLVYSLVHYVRSTYGRY